MQKLQDILKKVLISEANLQSRIAELGAQITHDYAGEPVLMICILRGGVMFLTDLIRHIDLPVAIDFMAVSSYGAGRYESSGNVKITLDLNSNLAGQNVMIVEDIIDSGHTLSSVVAMLETRRPKSLKICTLLDKAERREVPVKVDYVGFTIPNEFVFGYGLDLDEYYRNLPYIGVVDLERYHPES